MRGATSFCGEPRSQYPFQGTLEGYGELERGMLEEAEKTPGGFKPRYATYVRRKGSFAKKESGFNMYSVARGFEAGKEEIEPPYASSVGGKRKRVKVGERMRRRVGVGMKMIDAYEIAHEERELLQGAGWPLAPEVMSERDTRLLNDIRDEILKEHFGEIVVIARGEYRLAKNFEEAVKIAKEDFPNEKHRIIWDTKHKAKVPRMRGREFKYSTK